LFQKNQFTSTSIKQAAYLPFPHLETSVFRKTKMTPEDYDSIKGTVAHQRNKEIKATALLNIDAIPSKLAISIEPEESQHKLHANITGWPAEKHAQKQIAQQLAIISTKE
jgi:hypothetical protein